tara:strand:+ start:397 stop:618 length:222 start_codon:yes stop_codon:yes gene_type:complete
MSKDIVKCPKCQGFLYIENDIEGKYFSCLNCGLHKNISFARGVPTSKQTGYVSVQPRTKAGAYFQNSRRGAIN